MGELVEALVAALGHPREGGVTGLATGRRAVALRPGDDGRAPWRVDLDDGTGIAADAVILALPAPAAAALAAPVAPRAAAVLAAVTHASTAIVTLAFPDRALPRPLDGYGFVVPAGEGRPLTACTFSSAKFPGRAPEGHSLLRAFLGGPGRDGVLAGDDTELVATARRELGEILGAGAEPLFAVVHRHPRATPRLEVGHGARVAEAEAALPPGLHFAGAAYRGIGLPDCVASGRSAAAAVLAAAG
jgi:oxygen-dependent protoporphyrinogen oxidase